MRQGSTLIFLCISLLINGQVNLIPNASFEERESFQEIDRNRSWNKCLKDDTPDYFIFSYSQLGKREYSNYNGGPEPSDGKAYVGIFCYRVNPLRGVSNVREVLQVKLIDQLKKDSIYQFSMYIALDPESTHALKNLNILFRENLSEFKNENFIFKLNSQISFRDTWLDDTTWIELNSEYKARGYEKFLVLGNLKNDKSTVKKRIHFDFPQNKLEKWNLYDSEEAAYYYLDNLSLVLKTKKKSGEVINPDYGNVEIDSVRTDSITIEDVRNDSLFILKKIYFEFDKAELLPESTAELNRLLDFLYRYPEISIMIEGHTDNVGTHDYNIQLSRERASAVVEYLKSKGIPEERLQYIGYGFTRPLIKNSTDQNRSFNRRVAFSIIENGE